MTAEKHKFFFFFLIQVQRLLELQAPVMIAEKRKLLFLFLVQVQRLLELQSYLNGGVSDWPASVQTPAVKQEIHVPEPTGHNRPVLNPGPDAEQLLQSVKLEAPHAAARPANAAPVSKWTLAKDSEADQPAIPVSKWVAQEVRNCCRWQLMT